ncbi:DMT family transporter [Pseudomonas guariconensis]|uniref:DMT family transporter n=1 Tax=Pseudomonas TaxID=286 RepID=UPI0020979C58|nr:MULTISPECIES: DMT family transporter [Pseudomonas]MCO7641155.1 DMT family transporter [Pseudomonas sp. S 311-6]MCO7515438.1 DMT family transporter [Pseudomonas putida]MCO7566488.1 DMT family transporter [Pseudomonas mosselii]MCO7596530.1 DMT family transporter [Pseudomonas guariconensis]MCO7605453.1 DMT family transporter [Pseudomonas guariconensis]
MKTSDQLATHQPIAGYLGARGQLENKGTLAFLLGSLALSTVGIFVHEAGTDPLTATWFRCAFGLLGLTLWAAWRRQLSDLQLFRAPGFAVLAAGVLMVAAWGLFFASIEYISVGIATVLFHVQPLWVLLLGAFYLKEPVARRRIAAVLVAMLGLILATGILEHLSLFGSERTIQATYWLGVAFCLFGALCTACVTIIARQVRHTPAGTLAWWQCTVGAIALLPWPVLNGWPEMGVSWAWLSGLGLIHTSLAYGLIYAGMAHLNTDRIAVYQFFYPAVAIIIDWLFYGQSLGGLQLIGIAIMAVAIWHAER